jgi:hypothetical protein
MDEHREGIQADKPIPPWEQPGCFRMDCEPHRGDLLRGAGRAVLILGIVSLLPFGFFLAPLAVPLGIATSFLALSDLRKMRQGLMDPDGKNLTTAAWKMSLGGLLMTLLGCLIWIAPAFLVMP